MTCHCCSVKVITPEHAVHRDNDGIGEGYIEHMQPYGFTWKDSDFGRSGGNAFLALETEAERRLFVVARPNWVASSEPFVTKIK